MNKRILFTLLISLLIILGANAQVTIGSGLPPNRGALLDLKENDKLGANSKRGMLLPRVKLEKRSELTPLVKGSTNTDQKKSHTGVMLYNTETIIAELLCPGIHIWNGIEWKRLHGVCEGLSINNLASSYLMDGGNYSFTIYSFNKWTATVSDPHNILAIKPALSGNLGSTELNFKMAVKEDSDASATITFTDSQGASAVATINGKRLQFTTPANAKADADGVITAGSASFKPTSNSTLPITTSIVGNPTWVTIAANGTLSFEERKDLTAARSAVVEVKHAGLTKKVTLSQDALTLTIKNNPLNFGYTASTLNPEITTNSKKRAITLTKMPAWITGATATSVKTAVNATQTARTAILGVNVGTLVDLGKLTVNQAGHSGFVVKNLKTSYIMDGQQHSFNFDAINNWTATIADPDNILATKPTNLTGAAGNTVFTFKMAVSETTKRDAVITLKYAFGYTQTVTIKGDALQFTTPANAKADADGVITAGSASFKPTSNSTLPITTNIVGNPTWVTIAANGTLSFEERKDLTAARSAVVEVKHAGLTKKVTLSQDALTLTIKNNPLNFGYTASTLNPEITTNSKKRAITLTKMPAWITGATATAVKTAVNATQTARTAILGVNVGTLADLGKLTVNQAGHSGFVVKNLKTSYIMDGQQYSINFDAINNWTATIADPDNILATKPTNLTGAAGNTVFTFKMAVSETAKRDAVITLKYAFGYTQTVTIKGDALQFTTPANAKADADGVITAGSASFKPTSNSSLPITTNIVGNPTWVTIAANGTLTFEERKDLTAARSAVVEVKHAGLTKKVTLSQDALTLTIKNNPLNFGYIASTLNPEITTNSKKRAITLTKMPAWITGATATSVKTAVNATKTARTVVLGVNVGTLADLGKLTVNQAGHSGFVVKNLKTSYIMDGQQYSINFDAINNWTATIADPDNILATKPTNLTGASGNTVFTFKMAVSETAKRDAVITLKYAFGYTQTVTIKGDALQFTIPANAKADADGVITAGSASFKPTSNSSLPITTNIVGNPTWVTIAANGTLSFEERKDLTAARSAVVEVKHAGLTKKVTLSQDALTLTIKNNPLNFGYIASTLNPEITTNSKKRAITLTKMPAWITGATATSVKTAVNATKTARTVVLGVNVGTLADLGKVTVNQAGHSGFVVKNLKTSYIMDGQQHSINFDAINNWTATITDPDNILAAKPTNLTGASGNTVFTFKMAVSETAKRDAVITLKYAFGYTQTVTIKATPLIFKVPATIAADVDGVVTSGSAAMLTQTNSNLPVTISITGNPAWVKNTSGNAVFTERTDLTAARSATAQVKLGSAITKPITLSQAQLILNIKNPTLGFNYLNAQGNPGITTNSKRAITFTNVPSWIPGVSANELWIHDNWGATRRDATIGVGLANSAPIKNLSVYQIQHIPENAALQWKVRRVKPAGSGGVSEDWVYGAYTIDSPGGCTVDLSAMAGAYVFVKAEWQGQNFSAPEKFSYALSKPGPSGGDAGYMTVSLKVKKSKEVTDIWGNKTTESYPFAGSIILTSAPLEGTGIIIQRAIWFSYSYRPYY